MTYKPGTRQTRETKKSTEQEMRYFKFAFIRTTIPQNLRRLRKLSLCNAFNSFNFFNRFGCGSAALGSFAVESVSILRSRRVGESQPEELLHRRGGAVS